VTGTWEGQCCRRSTQGVRAETRARSKGGPLSSVSGFSTSARGAVGAEFFPELPAAPPITGHHSKRRQETSDAAQHCIKGNWNCDGFVTKQDGRDHYDQTCRNQQQQPYRGCMEQEALARAARGVEPGATPPVIEDVAAQERQEKQV
jgi:hypothetical protein